MRINFSIQFVRDLSQFNVKQLLILVTVSETIVKGEAKGTFQ